MKFIFPKGLAYLLGLATLLCTFGCGDGSGTTETQADSESTNPVTSEETEAESFPSSYEVTEDGDAAHVFTPLGLKYTVTGYEDMSDGTVAFTDSLVYTFDESKFANEFNRFTLTYTSTAPVKIHVTYVRRKKLRENYYFLEAGEGDFSGLLEGFMDGDEGKQLSSIRIETCTGEAAEFTLAGLSCELMAVPDRSLYLETQRFKLGIDLGWGGTINCIEDKSNAIEGLTNLVNKHDTGRLIQQSFYGTGAIEGVYQPGISFDSQWVYNPVQGGDQYNNSSRLIDLVITENSIYIKSQPQDWSLDGELTPSYMENTYTIEGDLIRVDNRFVDFSGWEHPYAGQELPALYTVSYLDTFVWYDGSHPWTGDTLSSRDNLNFWGDAAYANDCTFTIKEKNTETWCAWVNTDVDYGLGLYVPNADLFKAGRYAYDGTKSADENPCNYVAPCNTIKLISFQPLSYSYLLTAGSTSEIRATFAEHKDFSDNASLHENYISTRLPDMEGDITHLDFTTDADIGALMNPVSTDVAFDSAEQAVRLTAGAAGDVSVTIEYGLWSDALNADDLSTLRIEYMIPTDNSRGAYECDLFICAGAVSIPTGDVRIRKGLIADGEYHVLEIDLSSYAFWSGAINKIRFDYFDFSSEGDVMYVKGISLE